MKDIDILYSIYNVKNKCFLYFIFACTIAIVYFLSFMLRIKEML